MKPLARTLIVSALITATGLASAGPRYYGPPPQHHHHYRGPGLGGLVFGLAVALPLIALAQQADRPAEVVYVSPPAPLRPARRSTSSLTPCCASFFGIGM